MMERNRELRPECIKLGRSKSVGLFRSPKVSSNWNGDSAAPAATTTTEPEVKAASSSLTQLGRAKNVNRSILLALGS